MDMSRGSSAKQVLESLAQQPVFARCTKKELEAVSRLGTSILIEPGYVLTREGRRGYEFFVILEGEASCTIACVRRASALDEWRAQQRPARPPKVVTHLPVL